MVACDKRQSPPRCSQTTGGRDHKRRFCDGSHDTPPPPTRGRPRSGKPMSVHAMVWLHTSGRLYLLKPVHRAVIMQMAWRADETNDNWLTRYGIDRIAEESGTSPRTVMRAIEAASDPEIGILHAEKSHRKQTRYRFRTGAYESPKTPPLGDRGAPKTPPLGDRGAPDLVHMSHPICLLYTSPSPRDATLSRMPSSA